MPKNNEDNKTLSLRIRDIKSSSGIRALSEIAAEFDDVSESSDTNLDSEYRDRMRSFLEKLKAQSEVMERFSLERKELREWIEKKIQKSK